MPQNVAIVFGALGLLITYKLVSILITSHRHALRAKQMGCQSPPKYLKDDFLGLRALKEMSAAHEDKRTTDYLIERRSRISATEGRRVDTFGSTTLFRSNVFTVDPKNIQAVLATQFEDFGLGPIRRGNFHSLLGNGIFTTDGQAWEHSRAMLRPNFVRDQVADLELEERHVQNLMQALPINSDGWTEELNIQQLFFRITIDTATEFLFGESVDSQLANLPEGAAKYSKKGSQEESVFAKAFDTSQQWISYRGQYGKLYWICNPKELQECNKQCHAFADHFVQLALNHTAKDSDALEKGEKKDRYLFLEALAAQTRDPIEIRSQLLNILLAGRDTTASLLSWLFHFLIRHPAVLEKLRSEILACLGSYDEAQNLTFSGLKSCTYLQWCLHETLRLYPVVPINSRYALRDTTLPRGGGPDGNSPVHIRKGQVVAYSVHVLHRRPDIWGEDCDEFKPERWQGRKPGWDYLPFNGGPRICLGQQLALTEAGYVTVRLLQRFELVNMGAKETVEEKPRQNLTLTSCPLNGVWLRLKEATK